MKAQRTDGTLPDVLTATEMCQLLNITPQTFRRWRERGIFKGLESPLPKRYSRKRVERFLHGREFEAVS